jgi:phage virion morphogenesis protein
VSGASFTATFQDSEIRAGLARMRRTGRDPVPMLRAIGTRLVSNTQDRFDAAEAPDGTPWPALRPAYAAMKRGPGILRESGMRGGLQGSIAFDTTAGELAIGSNKIYAAVHQFGATIQAKTARALRFRLGNGLVAVRSVKIPARPYLGLSRRDEEDTLDVVEFFLTRRSTTP